MDPGEKDLRRYFYQRGSSLCGGPENPGPGNIKQIVAGPLAAPMNVLASGNSRRFEFFSNKTFNFAMISVDPRSPLPQMVVEFRDENNRPLYKTVINAAGLT